MRVLIAGLIIFFAVHSISIINAGWRNRMAAQLGEWTWKAGYGLVALLGLVLIIQGYGEARLEPVVLYTPPVWLRQLSVAFLIPVFPLLLAAYLPGRILSVIEHPMLAATKLWAAAHLLANGTLADVLLFGSFLVWAALDRISLRRRATPSVPRAPASGLNDALAVILGLGLYAAFVYGLHDWLIGVPVLDF
jgi:uncharacterized membrane protein